MTQDSPFLEIPLIALAKTLGERAKNTPIGPSIDKVSGDTKVSTIEEVPSIAEVSIDEVFRAIPEFSSDSSAQ